MAQATANFELRPGHVLCRVAQLDSKETLDFQCEKKIRAQDLIDEVYKHLNLDEQEKEYFSLFYYSDQQTAAKSGANGQQRRHEKIFLDPAKLARDQIPDGKHASSWNLSFGVKFYLSNPSTMLTHDTTRSLFCWQLCDDIRNNRVLVDRESSMRLSVLMLQAHLGDYNPEEHKAGYCFSSADFILLPQRLQPADYEARVIDLHKSKTGYNPEQAEVEFLELASKMPRYGMHLFQVEDLAVVMGNSYRGVTVFREEDEKCYEWVNLVKISYKKKKIKIRYQELEGVMVTKLHCEDHVNAKLIWKNAVDQHTFFRLARVEQPKKIAVMFGLSRRPSVRRTLKQIHKSEPTGATSSPSKTTRVLPPPSAPPSQPEPVVVDVQKNWNDPNWVVLNGPVPSEGKDGFEQQQVVVNFHQVDEMPENPFKYVIRCSNGSYKIEGVQAPQVDSAYALHVVSEDAMNATTTVSLVIDLDKSKDPSAAPVELFNSARLPVVNISAADSKVDSVVTAAVLESNQGIETSGEVTRFCVTKDTAGKTIEDDGSYEAVQVRLFLELEGNVFKSATPYQIMVQ